jgi:diacylglycerol kinase family enzyme
MGQTPGTTSGNGAARPDQRTNGAQPWLARLAFAAALASIAVLLIFAGVKSVGLLVVGVIGAILMSACLYLFLISRGPRRWLALAVVGLVPIIFLILWIRNGLLWVALLSLALAALCVYSGRAALADDHHDEAMPLHESPPPKRPFLIMNPHSGGGKVEKFGLQKKAEALGATVVLLDGPVQVDVAQLARDAADQGYDLLGVAGGDGTQALVAGIAAERGLPFLVISAGTRNHFALDLGLDREDPAKGLDALADGVEMLIDLGEANGRTFVNNISFGAYAEVVQSPEYRDDKTKTTLNMLPDILMGKRGAALRVKAAGKQLEGPQAVLVSNNPYGTTDLAGLGRRARLDGGQLGVATVTVDSAGQAIRLLNRAHQRGLERFNSAEIVVEADQPEIPAGIDGEAVKLTTPVHCLVHPQALRVRVPRDRPGVPQARPAMDWNRLRQLAFSPGGGRR